MSHEKDEHGVPQPHALSEKGAEGAALAWGKHVGRKAALVAARLPFLVALVRGFDPTGGKATGGIIRTGAGFFNLALKGVWGARINTLFDAFLIEVAEILDEDADRPIEEILGDGAFMDRLNKKAESFFNKEVLVVLEEIHRDEECTRFKRLTAAESYKDKEGKEHKKPGKFPVDKMSLERAMRKHIGFCFECYPEGPHPEEKADEHKTAPSKKVSPAEICGQYVTDAKDDAERDKRTADIQTLWQRLGMIADKRLKNRINELNTRAELESLIAVKDQAAFEEALRHLDEPGIGRTLDHLREATIDQVNDWAVAKSPEIQARLAAVEQRRSRRNGGETFADGKLVPVKRDNAFVRFFRALLDL